jgi:cupin 2 domain-containing protein
MNIPQSSQGNLFDRIPERIQDEIFELLFERPGVTIQRILSRGQTTDWIKQDRHEWVILVRGAAELLFDDGQRAVSMRPGDYLIIPAGCRHRVTWTDPGQTSIWLAIHVKD